MDPEDPIIQALQTINELSGAALEALLGGGEGGEGAPPAEPGSVPAPEEEAAPPA